MAESYERRRPTYPPELVGWIAETFRVGPGATVVDVGAGTGKLTRQLVATGATVVAVEPLLEMREQLVAAVPEVEVVAGSAEELPLPDGLADAVTAASAFHWFDLDRALPELHRVLRPGGVLAIVGNKRDLADPVQQEVQAVVGRYLPTAEEIGAWRPLLEASPLFEPAGEFAMGFEQLFDADGLAERVGTISYIARLDRDERAEVLARVREVGEAYTQPIAFRYRCEAHAYRRR